LPFLYNAAPIVALAWLCLLLLSSAVACFGSICSTCFFTRISFIFLFLDVVLPIIKNFTPCLSAYWIQISWSWQWSSCKISPLLAALTIHGQLSSHLISSGLSSNLQSCGWFWPVHWSISQYSLVLFPIHIIKLHFQISISFVIIRLIFCKQMFSGFISTLVWDDIQFNQGFFFQFADQIAPYRLVELLVVCVSQIQLGLKYFIPSILDSINCKQLFSNSSSPSNCLLVSEDNSCSYVQMLSQSQHPGQERKTECIPGCTDFGCELRSFWIKRTVGMKKKPKDFPSSIALVYLIRGHLL